MATKKSMFIAWALPAIAGSLLLS
ncbi:MAG: hypothetical protein H6Q78_1397, partial [Candidatus Krumholzibacteriota bacterium]|nr:hypothetical protein [Candidatus Krumholzibacteriota bacterium]